MTIATTRGSYVNIGNLVKMAFRVAGLVELGQSVPADKVPPALEFLDLIVSGSESLGIFARTVEFEYLQLVAGQYVYDLAADVLDVVGDGAFISPTETDITKATSEIIVSSMSREEWQAMPTKNTTSTPYLYYAHRTTDPIQLYTWPIPDAANAGTIRFQVHRVRADNSDANATPDFERFWNDWIVWRLAHDLGVASSLPLARCSYIFKQASDKLELCKRQAQPRGEQQIYADHDAGWR